MSTILTEKYSPIVAERFRRGSLAEIILDNRYSFIGAKTVAVSSDDVSPMYDYSRSGLYRYGDLSEPGRTIQKMTLTNDRGFEVAIDEGDKIQTDSVLNIDDAILREIDEVVIPEFDACVFQKAVDVAVKDGNYTSVVPSGVTFMRYLLLPIPDFYRENVRNGDLYAFIADSYFSDYFASTSCEDLMHWKSNIDGVDYNVGGLKVIITPSDRLPVGCGAVYIAKGSVIAPKQLSSLVVHHNPAGINGSVADGRFIYDAFVPDSRWRGVYAVTGQPLVTTLRLSSSAIYTDSGLKYRVSVMTRPKVDNHLYYYYATSNAGTLKTVTNKTTVDSDYIAMNEDSSVILDPSAGPYVQIFETTSAGVIQCEGTIKLY